MPDGHAPYSLSELDLAMIQAVPPGGNWKSIPESIPSKRLEQIRLSGGRTTLYGRLRWDFPSYTITTYFNRPGNGCYIHPAVDRVLTSWEAARLQSFPDSFRFVGSKTSRTKQIGNAVPPLLAYSIASKIRAIDPKLKTSIDLFSGSGGLSLGFEWAGFQTLLANDNFPDACETYEKNFPETTFIRGDISQPSTKSSILTELEGLGQPDLIVGGPPCQGFSNAGLRLIDDPRNRLYREFVEIVAKVNPKIFLMENVEGILSIAGGKTYNEIKETFEALGYRVHGQKLHAADYGVPQKRKRVVIIGSKIGDPKSLFPEAVFPPELWPTVADAISDIPTLTAASVFEDVQPKEPDGFYQELMQGKILPAEYALSRGIPGAQVPQTAQKPA